MQLRTGYKQEGKTGELCSCRQDTVREERQGAIQLQKGGKKGNCAAADTIQLERKEKSNTAMGGGLS